MIENHSKKEKSSCLEVEIDEKEEIQNTVSQFDDFLEEFKLKDRQMIEYPKLIVRPLKMSEKESQDFFKKSVVSDTIEIAKAILKERSMSDLIDTLEKRLKERFQIHTNEFIDKISKELSLQNETKKKNVEEEDINTCNRNDVIDDSESINNNESENIHVEEITHESIMRNRVLQSSELERQEKNKMVNNILEDSKKVPIISKVLEIISTFIKYILKTRKKKGSKENAKLLNKNNVQVFKGGLILICVYIVSKILIRNKMPKVVVKRWVEIMKPKVFLFHEKTK